MVSLTREQDIQVGEDIDGLKSFFHKFQSPLDQLSELAKYVSHSSAALINLLDEEKQYTVSTSGDIDWDVLPINESICRYTLLEGEPIIIEDTAADPRTQDISYVQDGRVQFYAGVPIKNPYGDIFGTLCIFDSQTRILHNDELEALHKLTGQLRVWVELYHKQKKQEELLESQQRLETLFSEIHHRIKNNLADIIGLLQIQESETTLDGVREALKKTEHRISTVAQIHEILYESNTYTQTNLEKYIKRLINTIADAFIADHKDISFEMEIEPIYLDINQTLPLGLIINEMVTNAIEHAFQHQDHGKVKIQLTEDDQDHVTLQLSDNGKGLEPGDRTLFDLGNLGMTLIHLLSNQLKASIQIQSNGGTAYYMRFPKKHS